VRRPIPSPRVVVRAADRGDIPSLVALLQAGALAGGVETPDNLEAYETALAEIEATVGTELLVAEVDGEVVGMCQVMLFRHFQHRGGLCAELESVFVRPDVRSHGIGSILVRHAIDMARQAGCYRVQLTSNVARSDSHRFYARLGFKPTHLGFKLWLEELEAPGSDATSD